MARPSDTPIRELKAGSPTQLSSNGTWIGPGSVGYSRPGRSALAPIRLRSQQVRQPSKIHSDPSGLIFAEQLMLRRYFVVHLGVVGRRVMVSIPTIIVIMLAAAVVVAGLLWTEWEHE